MQKHFYDLRAVDDLAGGERALPDVKTSLLAQPTKIGVTFDEIQ